MTRQLACALGALVLLCAPASGAAQSPDQERARQILEEAQAHEDAQRFALAAERYEDLYEAMTSAALPRAPIALWSIGRNLSQIPGREGEALTTLRRFLAESTALEDDAQVRDWRSAAVTLIAELEARAPRGATPGEALDAPNTPLEDGASAEPPSNPSTHISPVGPIILGVGGVTLLAGAVVGGVSLAMDADFRGACDDLSMCPVHLRPQYDEMRAFSTAADVLLVGGALVAAVGLVLTLTLYEGEGESAAAAQCTPDGCSVSLRGSF